MTRRSLLMLPFLALVPVPKTIEPEVVFDYEFGPAIPMNVVGVEIGQDELMWNVLAMDSESFRKAVRESFSKQL